MVCRRQEAVSSSPGGAQVRLVALSWLGSPCEIARVFCGLGHKGLLPPCPRRLHRKRPNAGTARAATGAISVCGLLSGLWGPHVSNKELGPLVSLSKLAPGMVGAHSWAVAAGNRIQRVRAEVTHRDTASAAPAPPMTSSAWARSVGYRGPYRLVSPQKTEGRGERCLHAQLIARTSAIGRPVWWQR